MARRGETIQDILRQLKCSARPNGKGEYKCHCPAHDDRNESLTVSEGEKGIVLHCHAGCGIDQICRALGLRVGDLFWDDNRQPGRSGGQKAAASGGRREKGPREYQSYEAAYGYMSGRVAKVYPYTDETGKLIFEVARIQLTSGDKTFRQHRPAHPEQGSKFPIICSVPAEISKGILYRLPEVKKAIAAGETIYVVEGEKDADTLAAMGLTGTTCPGGAKGWKPEHSQQLAGADVALVPDNDDSGSAHEAAVLAATLPVAARIRVVHLRDGYPELPKKGDITDLAELAGAETAKAILQKLLEEAKPAEATDAGVPEAEGLYKEALEIYNDMGGYCVVNGCTCQRTEDGGKVMATFVALPTTEITRDDGVSTRKMLEIHGWTPVGREMEPQYIEMSRFNGMNWATESWGLEANIMPGSMVRDKLRAAITSAGARAAKKKTVYEHTGWREINGKWCYLYQGGCIGAEDVTVDLGPGLEDYTLDGIEGGISMADAAVSSMSLALVMEERVAIPLLGVTYLAPLREFLYQGGNPPSFAAMIKGGTGSRKSTAAALFLSHFGQFTAMRLPASFNDTSNYVRSKAFYCKDMPLVVDDYYPTTSREEKRQMQRTAQLLSRAFGNQQERGRLAADLSIQRSRPPRSLAILTGELVPDIGASGIGRFYVIELEKNDVRADESLTDIQARASAGELRQAMRGYIEWLLPQAAGLTGRLTETFIRYRTRAMEMLAGSTAHTRTPEAVAHIMIGLRMMLDYFVHLEIYDGETAAELMEQYWETVTGNATRQAEESRDEAPTRLFLTALSELLTSKTLQAADMDAEKFSVPIRGMCGYMDADNYYLLADTVYGAVTQFYDEQGRMLPGNRAELFRQLRTDGIVRQVGSDGKTTRHKRTPDGKNQRLLWIPRWRIDGGEPPEPETKQEVMDFREVENPDLPEGWAKQ